MLASAILVIGVVLMVLSLIAIPIGLPGLWVMIGIVAVGSLAGEVPIVLTLILAGLAGLAELAEFLIVRWTSARYGGSQKAFWGALAGGLAGTLISTPVPLLGPLLGGLIGTFLGAAAVALWQYRRFGPAGRVAWGAVLGRALAATVKTATGVAILFLGGTALLVR